MCQQLLVISTSLSSADVSHLRKPEFYEDPAYTTSTLPPPPHPYIFRYLFQFNIQKWQKTNIIFEWKSSYTAGRFPGSIDRAHSEVSDGSGVVRGAFSYIDPRHEIRSVEYVADRSKSKLKEKLFPTL